MIVPKSRRLSALPPPGRGGPLRAGGGAVPNPGPGPSVIPSRTRTPEWDPDSDTVTQGRPWLALPVARAGHRHRMPLWHCQCDAAAIGPGPGQPAAAPARGPGATGTRSGPVAWARAVALRPTADVTRGPWSNRSLNSTLGQLSHAALAQTFETHARVPAPRRSAESPSQIAFFSHRLAPCARSTRSTKCPRSLSVA